MLSEAISSTISPSNSQFNWDQLVETFRFDCQLRNLSPKTIKCYEERLKYFARYLESQPPNPDLVSRTDIRSYILSLKGNVSDETVNGRIRVYRRFFNYLIEDGLWTKDNPMKGIRLLKTAKKIKTVVEPEQIKAIIQKANRRTFESVRNRLIITLFWDCMLRNKELRGLKLSDIDLQGRIIKVFGKGRKERMVPVGISTVKLLHKFLHLWRKKLPGDTLISLRNGEPLSERHCHKTVQRMGETVGIKLHPHLIRHSAATWYIRQGGSPVVLQAILGHSSLAVTQRYVHLTVQDAVASYEKMIPGNALKL